jgi:hypothetical protein
MSADESWYTPCNLDGLSSEELLRLWDVYRHLAVYCRLRAWAMDRRAAGDIPGALASEAEAEGRYKLLPEWARW